MIRIPLSLRLARRELKGGIGGFRVLLACLALGVATIAAADSLDQSMRRTLAVNARALLGGDAALSLGYRPPTGEENEFVARFGEVSHAIEMRAMAQAGESRGLVELKGVDELYPLYGRVTLDPPTALPDALDRKDDVWGAAVDAELLARLGLHVGDSVRVGAAEFRIRATVVHEPDRVAETFALGPRFLIAEAAVADTGLIQPGSLVRYISLMRLKPGTSVGDLRAALDARFPAAAWLFRDAADAAPGLKRFLDDLALFLALVGLTTLLVGGIGVADAVRGFLDQRIGTVAILKCLGAPRRLILATYAWQVGAVGLLGIAIGLAIGAAVPPALVAVWGDRLPVAAERGVYAGPLLLAGCFGALILLVFAAWPLARAAEMPPAALFRDIVAPMRARIRPRVAAGIALAALALGGLAVATAADRALASWFVAGALAAFLVFALAGRGLAALAGFAARGSQGAAARLPLRLALSSLHRPGAPTPGAMLSLGLGLTVLVAVALVQANIARQIDERLPGIAPTFFFIDIPSAQGDAFDKAVAEAGGRVARRAPMIRGRITRINGTPVEQVKIAPDAMWAVRGDRGLSTADIRPQDARIVAGDWWPADWNGPPQVSIDAALAKGFGVGLGDTISVNVLGREITARIRSLRDIDWSNVSMNFALLLSPNALAGAPHSDIASVFAPAAAEAGVEKAVAAAAPSATAIRVREALDEIRGVMGAVADAIRAAAAVTLIAGALVLAGAVAAGRQRRLRETVLLKVLGARRADLLGALALEYLLLGASAALIAAALGTAASWAVIVHVLHAQWSFLLPPVGGTVLASVAGVLALGLGLTIRILAVPPAPQLRHE